MKCPHCLVAFHEDADTWDKSELGNDRDGDWGAESTVCPECGRLIVRLVEPKRRPHPIGPTYERVLVYPKAIARSPLPPEVP